MEGTQPISLLFVFFFFLPPLSRSSTEGGDGWRKTANGKTKILVISPSFTLSLSPSLVLLGSHFLLCV